MRPDKAPYGNDLSTALPQIITAIVAASPQIIDGIVTAVLNAIPQIVQAGIDLLIALIEALPQIISTIVQAIPQIIAAIVKGFASGASQMASIGLNLISKRQIVLNRRYQKDIAGSGFTYRLHGWQPWQAIFRPAAARQCGQEIFQIACRI